MRIHHGYKLFGKDALTRGRNANQKRTIRRNKKHEKRLQDKFLLD